MKIYVTGSMIQYREIRLIANVLLKSTDNEVKYVKSSKELTLDEYIQMRFEYIDWCDVVYILEKENGELCDSVVYEKVYAQKYHKEIWYIV